MLLFCFFSEILLMQHLDISDDKQFTSDVARQLLGQPGILPALVSLDVSGRKQVCECLILYVSMDFIKIKKQSKD